MAQSKQIVPRVHDKMTAKDLGIFTSRPKFPQYASMTQREESFKEAEFGSFPESITVTQLAEAGLVYTGVGDSVRCYHCGGGLRNWEVGDEPILEHARWYPDCGHVLLVKGPLYVKDVLEGNHTQMDCISEMETPKQSPESLVAPSEPVDFGVQALLEIGYSESDVKLAMDIFNKRHSGGKKYNSEDLYEILYEMYENPSIRTEFTKQTDCEEKLRKLSLGDDSCESQDEEDITKLTEENQRLREDSMCKICLDNQADIIFLPCAHIVSCGLCASALANCPVCRKHVQGMVKAYFAIRDDMPKETNRNSLLVNCNS